MADSRVYTSPSVRITPVPTDLLRFPPDPLPSTLPPPAADLTLSHPFAIPTDVYNSLLSVQVPLTVALVYATTVIILNQLNAKRNYKPWMVSTTRPFRAFVIAHNIFLALFSAWTFVGLLNAVRLSLDGAVAEHGLVGMVDVLCKINGPRGLGDAATFNASTSAWGFTNRALKLAANHLPDTTDLGRIWNEGLAFYGWLFYVSKFYEVVDTLIILAKGRKSSFLQTYHHAGAMMCMWAGIRYMAPPIWMFVLVNSLIHVFMVSRVSRARQSCTNRTLVPLLRCNDPRYQGAQPYQADHHHNADSSVSCWVNLRLCTPFHRLHHSSLRALHLFLHRSYL